MSGPFTAGHKVFNTDLNPILLGWVDFSWFGSTLTWVSTDGPTFVLKINADVTAVIEPGMRVKLTQTTDKFFIVTAVSTFSGGFTQVTVYGGTDYTLLNASISAGSFSTHKKPFGFNASPAKWTETLTDTTARSQASPVSGTWYNPGSLSLSIPIGAWDTSIQATLDTTKTGTAVDQFVALSTSASGASDADLISYHETAAIGATTIEVITTHSRQKTILLAAKTTYFVVVQSTSTPSGITLSNVNDKLIVRAVCAYL